METNNQKNDQNIIPNDTDKPQKGVNVPNLRFPEFNIAYIKSSLGSISKKIERKIVDQNNIPVTMISYGNGFILQSNKYSRNNAGNSLQKYTLLKKGELAYNHGASKNKPYGVCYELKEFDEALVPFVYHNFSIVNGISKYWNYALNTEHIDRQLKRLVSSGARMDGLLNISYTDYMSIKIYNPNIVEQQKIANFLSLIDQRIVTQNKIIEDLECQIKWIKVKFFNSYINCSSYQFNNLFFEYKKLNNLAYKQYTIGKYGIKELNYDSNFYTTNKHIIFEPNTLILGIGIEEIGVSDELFGCCSPIYKTFRINNQIINTCWFYYFASMYFDKIKRFVTQKSTRREFEFDYKALNIIKFSIPTLDIQKIHCDLLNFISTKIQKEKDILELYKKQKAYLLKNMFI